MTWIAVDFDQSLALYDPDRFPEVGEPIMPMVDRVRAWLAEGQEVRIFTARAADTEDVNNPHYTANECESLLAPVREFCREHFGRELATTATKDFECVEMWDDRAVQLIPDVGVPLVELLAKLNDHIAELEAALEEVTQYATKARVRLALTGNPL